MTTLVTPADRFATSSGQVVKAVIALLLCIVALMVVSTTLVQEFLGYTQQSQARVVTFMIRMFFLIGVLASIFFLVTATSFYKRNKVAVAPWLFLAVGLIFFMVYVIVPIFQS